METATKHQCKHGCGYEHDKRGPMNLHELYHCPKLKQGGEKQSKKQGNDNAEMKKTQSGQRIKKVAQDLNKQILKCDCETGPTLAFLSPSNPVHAHFLSKGGKKYCTVCEEVF